MLRVSFCCRAFSLRSSSIAILIYFMVFQCSIIGCAFAIPEISSIAQMISLSWNVFVIFWILLALYGIDPVSKQAMHLLIMFVYCDVDVFSLCSAHKGSISIFGWQNNF